ncbi:50S ribosomal protein L18 [Candidatus Woesebacteria bacterium GWC1_42_13]|uniref:Large ribosomal subunit protein uL18 n=1 Tax=Candidatus Woesebacteria bacterium GWC1_42_13 TaxID=1802475 RepID=A0A1F7WWA6_9BACT|nr:MAG: 50S ribosomal protein L18 [Candidatus Woesebacteria bacterium GWC1_42_13]
MINKLKRKLNRERRTRVKIARVGKYPRLSVYRSNKHIFAQIIDDSKGNTLVAVSDKSLAKGKEETLRGVALSETVGIALAEKAKAKKISKVTFDRGSYKYHGRVKALAEGARKGGLNF